MPCTRSRPHARWIAATIAAALLLAGCGDGGLEIAGSYVDQFNFPHVITDAQWDSSTPGVALLFHIREYDNDANVLLAENDAGNAYEAGLFSRFTWTYAGGQRYFCQDPYNADTLEDARNASPPYPLDLLNGCAGFAWSQLIPQ